MPLHRIAVIIPNYNMPERTDALVEYIEQNTTTDYDIFVVDNGSDLVEPSKYTSVCIRKNRQTTFGWLVGLKEAYFMEDQLGEPYYAYWIMITSAEFVEGSGDPLTPLVDFLIKNRRAAGVHPALTPDSTSALMDQMADRGSGKPRQTYLIDNIAALWRANFLNRVGFREELTMGWGVSPETCWMARQERKSIWIHEGVKIKKISDVGYSMNRMNMTAEDRRILASAETKRVLEPIYGPNYLERLAHEWTRYDHSLGEWVVDYG